MPELRICAVPYDRRQPPDAVLAEVAVRLAAAGLTVRGLLQRAACAANDCCPELFLQDIGQNRQVQIFERRGRDARGCRLDQAGLAEAAAWLREAIEADPDVLFINRFGRQEAEGRGLLGEIGLAASRGLLMVVPVQDALLPAWKAFAGEDCTCLAAKPVLIESWCLRHARSEEPRLVA